MSNESQQISAERHEVAHADPVADMVTGAGRPLPGRRYGAVRVGRDAATEIINSMGLVAMAALETADVVGRAAGRLAYDATRDMAQAGTQLVHDLGQACHDSALDTAQTAVDAGLGVGAQIVRGATGLSKQGRELMGTVETLARGLVGLTVGMLGAATSQRVPKEPVAAVPIVVN